MRSVKILLLSVLFGSPDFYLLEGFHSRFLRFFNEKPIPGNPAPWQRRWRLARTGSNSIRGYRKAEGL